VSDDFNRNLSGYLNRSLVDTESLARSLRPPTSQLNPAQWMYERIAKQVAKFEESLNPDEEVGARFVAAPGEGVIHIDDAGYWGPDMLIFYGKNAEGRPVQVLQHYTQVSITLTALPAKEPEPRRVGFVLLKKVEA
jgi:hypothetical protein